MFGWALLNVVTSMIPTLIIVYKLAAYPTFFTALERWGMGAIGAALVLRVAPIVSAGLFSHDTPFDDWATTLLGLGLTLYFVGRLLRRVRGQSAHG